MNDMIQTEKTRSFFRRRAARALVAV